MLIWFALASRFEMVPTGNYDGLYAAIQGLNSDRIFLRTNLNRLDPCIRPQNVSLPQGRIHVKR